MPDIPEFYVDQVILNVAPFGTAMTFGLGPPHPSPGQTPPAQEVVRIRMSLEHAKVLAILLKRQLKAFEEQGQVTINIPRIVYRAMGLSEQEDW